MAEQPADTTVILLDERAWRRNARVVMGLWWTGVAVLFIVLLWHRESIGIPWIVALFVVPGVLTQILVLVVRRPLRAALTLMCSSEDAVRAVVEVQARRGRARPRVERAGSTIRIDWLAFGGGDLRRYRVELTGTGERTGVIVSLWRGGTKTAVRRWLDDFAEDLHRATSWLTFPAGDATVR